MSFVSPHVILFRGGAEGHIRRYLIEDRNYLDAVIGLPANIFYGTSIPTCVLVFKRCREYFNDILFIDASQQFGKRATQNYLRGQDIDRIVTTCKERSVQEKYSYVATLDEVKRNDYNLNIPRYVDTFEEQVPVDLESVSRELQELELAMTETDKTIAEYCKQLRIVTPF
jgi:type I restriction enzyme M protein